MFFELMNTSKGAAAILDDVVQSDVERVLAVGPADLVGLAGQRLRALKGCVM